MGTSVITHTQTDPFGVAVEYVANFRLTTAAGQQEGFRLSDGTGISALATTTSNSLGAISISLENNSNIVPAGSFYVAELLLPSSAGGTMEAGILSSSSVSPQSIYSALINPIPSYVPFSTVPASVLAANNIFTGTNQFNGNVYFKSGSPWYDVKAFGAVGNGATDDTVAIQAAIDACDLGGGGTVYFPPGTYLVTLSDATNARCLKLKSSTRYLGAGPASIIKLADNAAGNVSGTRVMGTAATVLDHVQAGSAIIGSTTATTVDVVSGANFSLNQYLSSTAVGEILQVTQINANQLTVTRDVLGTGASASWVNGSALQNQYHDIIVESLTVDGNYLNQSSFHADQDDGIFIGPGFANKVIRCELKNCRADQLFFFSSHASLAAHNSVHDGQRVGLNMRGASFTEFSNNHIYNCINWAMKMEEAGGDIACQGNIFSNNECWNTHGLVSLTGVSGGRLTDMIVNGNTWIGPAVSGVNAITTLASDRITISNNILNGGWGTSISVVRDATFIKILNNQISGIGDSGGGTVVGAIVLGGGSTTQVTDILVKGNTIYQAPHAGIQLLVTTNVPKEPLRVIIEDNHIEHCGFQGIDFVSGTDCHVRGNVLYANGGSVAASTVTGGSQAGIFFRAGAVVPTRPLVMANTFVGSAEQTKGIDAQTASVTDATFVLNVFSVTGTPIAPGSSGYVGDSQMGLNFPLGGASTDLIYGTLHGLFST